MGNRFSRQADTAPYSNNFNLQLWTALTRLSQAIHIFARLERSADVHEFQAHIDALAAGVLSPKELANIHQIAQDSVKPQQGVDEELDVAGSKITNALKDLHIALNDPSSEKPEEFAEKCRTLRTDFSGCKRRRRAEVWAGMRKKADTES